MDTLFETMAQMSMTASVVIVAVLLVRLLLRRAPKIFSYLLWMVVLFRLVCPVALESPFGIPQPFGATLAAQSADQTTTGETAQSKHSNETQNGNSNTAENTASGTADKGSNSSSQAEGNQTGVYTMQSATAHSRAFRITEYAWLGGVMVLLFYSIISYGRLKKSLLGALHVSENIYEMWRLPTPFVLGVFAPCIYLPTGLSGEEREYILAHEKMHIRRHDHIIKLIAFLTLIMHWMNPLVWVAFCCMTKDMEMSCDEAVIKSFGTGIKKEYSESLLRMAMPGNGFRMVPLAFGEGNVENRIKNVLHYKKAGRGILVAGIAVVLVSAVLLMTNRAEGQSFLMLNRTDNKNLIRVSIEDTTGPDEIRILQEHQFKEDVNSYMVFAACLEDGEETARYPVASGTFTEDNRQGELDLALQYAEDAGNDSLTISATEDSESRFLTLNLSDYQMRAGSVLWQNEKKYHDITTDTPYLVATEYIGDETVHSVQTFDCEAMMTDASIWDAVVEQSKDSGITTVMVYYVISDKTEEALQETLDDIPLHTESIELPDSSELPQELAQMYQWRTPYVGNNSAVGNITDAWFVSEEAPLTKNGFSLSTEDAENYGCNVMFETGESAQDAYAKNEVCLERDAVLFFALVENAKTVTVTINEEPVATYERADLEEKFQDLWSNSETYDDFCKLYQYIVYCQTGK